MAKMSEKDPKDLDSIEKFLKDADIASTLVNEFQSQEPDSIAWFNRSGYADMDVKSHNNFVTL